MPASFNISAALNVQANAATLANTANAVKNALVSAGTAASSQLATKGSAAFNQLTATATSSLQQIKGGAAALSNQLENVVGVANKLRGAMRLASFAGRFGGAVGDVIDRAGPSDTRTAIATGGSSSYTNARGAAGATRYGLEGLAFGASVGGGPGALIGGITGSVVGFVKASQDASRDIQAARLDISGHALHEQGQFLTHGVGSPSSYLSSLNRQHEGLHQANEGDRNALGYRIASLRGDDSGSKESYVKAQAELLKSEGETIKGVVASRFNLLAAQSPGSDTHQLVGQARQDKTIAGLIDKLGSGYNPSLPAEAALRQGQQSRANAITDTTNDGLIRLGRSADATAVEMARLDERSKALVDAFNGSVSAVRLSAGETGLNAPGSRSFRSAYETISAGLGGPQGQEFARQGADLNSTSNLLPGLLGQVAKEGHTTENDFVNSIRAKLSRVGTDEDTILSVVSSLRSQIGGGANLGNVINQANINPSGLSDKLLSNRTGPYAAEGGRLGRLLAEHANSYGAGLSEYHRQQGVIDTGKDNLSLLTLSRQRTEAEFAADANGRRGSGLDNLTLAQLQQPYNQRQARLTEGAGLVGSDSFSPQKIAAALATTQASIGRATTDVQDQFAKNPRGAGFTQAADQLAKLKDNAASLQTALQRLANASERTAGLQEKLSKLNEDKQGRLGFAESYLSSGPDERLKTQNGLLYAASAKESGKGFDGLLPEQISEAIRALNQVANVKLNGLGGQTGQQLKDELLSKTAGGVFGVQPDAKKETDDLKGQILDAMRDAEGAQKQLIDTQSRNSDTFFAQLGNAHAQFFAKLSDELARSAPINPVARAAGGPIDFTAKGTDTVPAMLTPGEYVVDAASTRANFPLLRRMTAEKGKPLYRAVGGPVDDGLPPGFGIQGGLNEDIERRQKAELHRAAVEKLRGDSVPPGGGGEFAQFLRNRDEQPKVEGDDARRIREIAERNRVERDAKPFERATARNLLEDSVPEGPYVKRLKAGIAWYARSDSGSAASGSVAPSPANAPPSAFAQFALAGALARSDARRPGGSLGQLALRDLALRQDRSRGQWQYSDEYRKYLETAPGRPLSYGEFISQRLGVSPQQVRFPVPLAAGGPVPGHGTGDSIPAMLAPGEFVLSRSATSRAGVGNLQHFNDGGVVQPNYLGNGPSTSSTSSDSALASALTGFASIASQLSVSIQSFNPIGATLAEALKNFPTNVKHDVAGSVSVILNGAEVLSRMYPALSELITEKVTEYISRAFKQSVPDALQPTFD